jgi:hypothetical protein
MILLISDKSGIESGNGEYVSQSSFNESITTMLSRFNNLLPSLATTDSIILVTTQNSSVGGDEYPAVVSSKTNGSFGISHNYGGTLEVGYLIINATP